MYSQNDLSAKYAKNIVLERIRVMLIFLDVMVFWSPKFQNFLAAAPSKWRNGRNVDVTVAPRALAALRAAC